MVFEWRLPASLPGQLILSPDFLSGRFYFKSILGALFFALFSSHGFSCAFLPVEMGCPYCTSQCLRFRSLSPIFTFSNDHLLGAHFRDRAFGVCTMKASSGRHHPFQSPVLGAEPAFSTSSAFMMLVQYAFP